MKEIFTKFLAFVMLTGISWGCMALIVQLIAECFDKSCTLKQATGIWLIIILLRVTFNFNGGKK